MAATWVVRWRLLVSKTPVLPGVWKLRGGGFVASAQIRGRTTSRGKRAGYTSIFRVMREARTAKQALVWLEAEKERLRQSDPLVHEVPIWKDFALAVLENKIAAGDMQSAAGIANFKGHLANIIRTAAWATLPIDQVRHAHIQAWRDVLPTLTWKGTIKLRGTGEVRVVRDGKYGPRSLNCWIATAAHVWKLAAARFELPRNPFEGVKSFSTKTAKTYTREEPNALNPRTEVVEFLARFKKRFPHLYAFVFMGFVLGQRPSTLRPLRRRGLHADIDLVEKKLFIRRSHSLGDAIMETTKTGNELELSLPDDLVEILKDHVARIEAHPIGSKSDLLFPSLRTGKAYSRACLNYPFAEIMKEMGLSKKLTARAMRRTYQDLADEAKLRTVTAMAVSGHKTLGMKHHYSTAHDDEVREGIGKVIDLATARRKASAERKT